MCNKGWWRMLSDFFKASQSKKGYVVMYFDDNGRRTISHTTTGKDALALMDGFLCLAERDPEYNIDYTPTPEPNAR